MAQQLIENGTSGLVIRESLNAMFNELYGGGRPSTFIAASNTPDAVKAVADYVCDGTDDDLVIQAVIDSFPTLPDIVRSKVLVTGGKYGQIVFAGGKFNFSNEVVIPAGSVISLVGQGVSSWRPIDPAPNQYEGGTQFYSTDPNGKILVYPQYTGNRVDDGLSNTIPASGIILRDIEMRVFNPATTQNYAALDLDGMTTGVVENINVFADLSTNATPRISEGVSLNAGARSDRKYLKGIHSFFFRDSGFQINTTHIDATQLVAGNISGGSSPAAFHIQADQNQHFANLHGFLASIGLKISNSSSFGLDIDSFMFETITTPVLVQLSSNLPTYRIRTAIFNVDVSWTGDITTKVRVDYLSWDTDKTLNIQQRGSATILSGQTSVVVTHKLVAAPTLIKVEGTTSDTASHWVSSLTSTQFTINVPSAVGADRTVYWDARTGA